MAITREQKENIVKQGSEEANSSTILLFTDVKGSGVGEIRELRKSLMESGAKFHVIKKRLLRIILKNGGMDVDPVKIDGSIGVVFGKKDMADVIQPVYKFSKAHENFKVVGGVNVTEKMEIPMDMIETIGRLPSREVVLGQLLGALTSPLRGFAFILDTLSKRSEANAN